MDKLMANPIICKTWENGKCHCFPTHIPVEVIDSTGDYKYLGDFSATPPQYSRGMFCDDCKVRWTGCWDNFQCPQCGQGELPSSDPNDYSSLKPPSSSSAAK
jgi:hypothetical protein